MMPIVSRHAWLLVFTMAFLPVVSAAPARAAVAVAPEESAVSTGSWQCSRYLEAASAATATVRGGAAAELVSAVRQFALGYVYGVSESVGKPFPEGPANEQRIVELLGKGCSQDPARAIRDSTLLAGRAMLDDARSQAGAVDAGATGSLACNAYLDARSGGNGASRLEPIRNWADGYINARFERAGRGLIPTAKNKALMLERFSAACSERPAGTVRDAARTVVEATLPGK
jgi:hypothetical protein